MQQRYRINHQLVIGLFVGAVVLGIVAYFLRSWQVSRLAGARRDRAQQELAEGNYLEAFEQQSDYVLLRRDEEDEAAARIALANIGLEVLDLPEADREQRGRAWGALEDAVRRTGDPQLRLELAKLILTLFPAERAADALEHVEELLRENPGDPELNLLQVRALYRAKDNRRGNELAAKLIGFNRKSKKFREDGALVPDEPEIYYMLARSYFRSSKYRELSRIIIDRMVAMNPESAVAHLRLSLFEEMLGNQEEAAEALQQAAALDPQDAAILYRQASFAMQNENPDQAYEVLVRARQEHPEDMRFYTLLAQTEFLRKNYDAAVKLVDEAVLKFGKQQALMLMLLKIDVYFVNKDYASISKALKELTNLNVPGLMPMIDYVKARVKFTKGQWLEAARDFKRVRPLLINNRALQARAGNLLARCYEQLGMFDLAKQAYMLVLNDQPQDAAANQGLARVNQRINPQAAETDTGISGLVRSVLALPEAEQDWEKVEQVIEEAAEKFGWTEVQQLVTRAQVLIQRKMYPEAEQLLQTAAQLDPQNASIRHTLVGLAAVDPARGPARALEMLDAIVAAEGSTLRSRARRATLLLALNLETEDLTKQILDLAEGIEEWPVREQTQLLSTLATQLQQLGQLQKSQALWNRVIAMSPEELPPRIQLFENAYQQQDDQAMQEAQQAVLALVKDKQDPNYVLTEAKRMLLAYVQREISREQLAAVRDQLDQALLQRPEWHALHIAYGQLLMALNVDLELALQHFNDALKYGPPSPNALVLHVRLLDQFGQYATAQETMQMLPAAVRRRTLGKVEANVLWNVGEQEEAFLAAQRVAEEQNNDPATQVWFANFAQRAQRLDEAAAALQRALELDPSQLSSWTQLADVQLRAKDGEALQLTLRNAQLALDAEFIPLLMAKSYQYRGLFFHAEDIYLAVLREKQLDPSLNHQLAEFYLIWGRQDDTKQSSAFQCINRILRTAYDGTVPWDNPHVVWAADQAARRLAGTREYQQFVKARRLLERVCSENESPVAQQRLLAEILSTQRDPASQLQAVRIFEDLHQRGQLQKQNLLSLAELLSRTGNWEQAESLLTTALPTFRDDPDIWSAYVNLLLDHGELGKAAAGLNRLQDLAPQSPVYTQLLLRLTFEKGDQQQLRRMLKSLAPQTAGAVDASQLKNVLQVAQLAVRYQVYDLAEELFRFYASRNPEGVFELLRFLALHGDVEEAVEMMREQFQANQNRGSLIQLAVSMMRARRPEIGNNFDAPIDQMVDEALRNDPDSTYLKTLQAELLDAQQKYDESIAAYDKILERDDLIPGIRAAVMNNLGFLLALRGERLDDASQLIEAAMEIYGPVDAMLDTRAVLHMARQRYDQAVEDLLLATSVSSDPVQYYHLAQAQLLAGNPAAAADAWKQAQKLKFDEKLLGRLEQEGYQQIQEQLEAL